MNGIKLRETIDAIDEVFDEFIPDNVCGCTDSTMCPRCLWEDLKLELEEKAA